jgi:hypothetical protein
VRVALAVLVGWTVLREAEVGPLRAALHGPAFGKLAYWIVIVGAGLLTVARARAITGRERMAWALIGAVVLEALALLVGGFGESTRPGPGAAGSLSPLLTAAGSASWIAFGMVVCTGLIALFIRLTLRGSRPSAVQSATGFFYLAVITAFTAEMAAKLRFLP